MREWIFVAFGLALIMASLRRPRAAVVSRILTSTAAHGIAIVALTGCAALMPALAAAAQGAQWLGTVLDVAEAGADAYLDRHPSRGVEATIDDAARRARIALAAFDGALAAGKAVDDDDLAVARAEAVEAYSDLRDLLDDLGVLRAVPPAGGAETAAPLPGPVELPSRALVKQRLTPRPTP